MSKANVYCQNVFDGTHESPTPSKGNHKLITSKNIMNGYIDSTDAYYISDEDYKKIQIRSAVKQWDVLISMIGTVGNVCIVQDKDIDYAIKNMGVFSCGDEYKAKWLYYYLQSPYLKKLNRNYLNGAIQKFLPLGYLRNLDIPDFVQNKIGIVDLLWNLDSKISLNNKIISELESMAKTIYDYWFLQFEFPNEEGKPYKSSGGKMVWNEELKREIPEGWKVKPLKGLYSIERGISYNSNDISELKDGIPMLNLACIDIKRNYRDGELKYFNKEVKKEKMLNSGDMLIATTDLTRNADIVGSPILVPYDTNKYTYSMDLAKIDTVSPMLNKWYLYSSLRTEYYHNFIKKWASGTNVLHLNLTGIDWYQLIIPSLETQEKYAKLIKEINKKESQVLSENQELTSLRDFLLPLLMNGQVGFKNEAK